MTSDRSVEPGTDRFAGPDAFSQSRVQLRDIVTRIGRELLRTFFFKVPEKTPRTVWRCQPWGSSWATRKIDIEEFPNVKRWLEEIGERAAVKKAMAMGPEFRVDPASISSEEQARRRKLVADQRAQPIPSEWVRAA